MRSGAEKADGQVIVQSIDRIGSGIRPFWPLMLLAGLGLFIALAAGQMRVTTSVAASAIPVSPVARVLYFATSPGGSPADSAIDLPSGARVKSSNYRGVRVGATTYYYNLAPHPSYDPLGRGEVTASHIQVVAVVGDPPARVMVYTISPE